MILDIQVIDELSETVNLFRKLKRIIKLRAKYDQLAREQNRLEMSLKKSTDENEKSKISNRIDKIQQKITDLKSNQIQPLIDEIPLTLNGIKTNYGEPVGAEYQTRLLDLAIKTKDKKVIKSILALSPEVNYINREKHPPLSEAILAGDISTIRTLLRQGANPNKFNSNEFSPLCLALAYSNEADKQTIVELLIEAGADPALQCAFKYNKKGYCAFSMSEVYTNPTAMEVLIRGVNDPTQRDSTGMPSLTQPYLYGKSPRVIHYIAGRDDKGKPVDGTERSHPNYALLRVNREYQQAEFRASLIDDFALYYLHDAIKKHMNDKNIQGINADEVQSNPELNSVIATLKNEMSKHVYKKLKRKSYYDDMDEPDQEIVNNLKNKADNLVGEILEPAIEFTLELINNKVDLKNKAALREYRREIQVRTSFLNSTEHKNVQEKFEQTQKLIDEMGGAILFGHQMGIDNKIDFKLKNQSSKITDIELSGFTSVRTIPQVSTAVNTFSAKLQDENRTEDVKIFERIKECLEISSDFALNKKTAFDLLGILKKGNPIAVPVHYEGHHAMAVFHNNKIYLCNRGGGTWVPGIKIYEYDPLQLNLKSLNNFLNEERKLEVPFEKSEAAMHLGIKHLKNIRRRGQKSGNCTYTNTKRSVEALMIAFDVPAEKQKKLYHEFTSFDRQFSIDNYFKAYEYPELMQNENWLEPVYAYLATKADPLKKNSVQSGEYIVQKLRALGVSDYDIKHNVMAYRKKHRDSLSNRLATLYRDVEALIFLPGTRFESLKRIIFNIIPGGQVLSDSQYFKKIGLDWNQKLKPKTNDLQLTSNPLSIENIQLMNSHGYKVNPVVENTNDQGRKVKTRKKALWSDRRNKNVARNPILTEDAIKIYQILDPILNESRKLNHVNKRQAKVLNDLSEVIFAQGIEDYMHQKRSFKISEHGQELLQLIEQFVSEQPRLKGSRVVCNLQDQIKSELTSPKLR